jgi:GDPmannose 4,6-dehydratase
MKKALITGIAGQDGSYLAEYLLSIGYEVFGIIRSELSAATNLGHIMDRIQLFYGDLTDYLSILAALKKSEPDEIYNLAGQPFVPNSWICPAETFDVNTSGLARILEIVERTDRRIKVYQASSSEMYGNHNGACTEATPMLPTSPYGVSKLASHHLCRVYRDRGLYVVGGILFNHESPRRGPEMVTRKITQHIAGWLLGGKEPLRLGNIEVRRDWGFAGDYVRAMHLMLQQEKPRDYVIGMGETHSVREFLNASLREARIPYASVENLITFDPAFVRENEIYYLCADAHKAHTELGWEPQADFDQLVRMMVQSDLELIAQRLSSREKAGLAAA